MKKEQRQLLSTKNRRPLVQGRIETKHGFYRIVAGQTQGTCRAIAYLGGRKMGAQDGETIEAAVESVKAALDERTAHLRRSRIDGVPSAAEFRDALMAIEASHSDPVIALLAAHSQRPNAVATMAELARLHNRDEGAIATAYARLGRKLGVQLGFTPEPNDLDPKLAPILTFAAVETRPNKAGTLLRLRPEVVAALGEMDHKGGPPRL